MLQINIRGISFGKASCVGFREFEGGCIVHLVKQSFQFARGAALEVLETLRDQQNLAAPGHLMT